MSSGGFHVHGPHDHAVEHAASGHGDGFSNRIAVMTAILATVGALFGYLGGATQNDAALFKNNAAIDKTEAAIALLEGERASIIGGAQVFNDAIAFADEMIVTHIDHAFQCDTFFPAIDPVVWMETARETHRSDASGVDYAFVTYQRK